MEDLKDPGYLRIPNLLTVSDVNIIRSTARLAESSHLPTASARLADSEDITNNLYTSSRSPGLRYAYLDSIRTQAINRRVAEALQRRTGLDWWTGINREFLPIFTYGNGGHIKAHRGRDIGYGPNNFVAVGMLTSPGIDYQGGEFYLNPVTGASPDGKTVWNDFHPDRIYFKLQRGEVLVFDNRKFVHGTTPVQASFQGNACRLTCSWRTSSTTPATRKPNA